MMANENLGPLWLEETHSTYHRYIISSMSLVIRPLCFAAGDYDSTEYDAEINSHNDNLQVYRSDVGGSGSLVATKSTVKTALLIRLSKNQMYVTNYEGVNYYKEDVGLFAFDTMYMGLNRVVNHIYGPTRRTGRGVCSVCIYFLNDTVKDLHEWSFIDPVTNTVMT